MTADRRPPAPVARHRAVLLEVSPEFGDVGYVDRTADSNGLSACRIGYRAGWRHRSDLHRVRPGEVERAARQASYLPARAHVARSIPSWR